MRSADAEVRSAVLGSVGVDVPTLIVGLAIGLDLRAEHMTSGGETAARHEHGAATTSAEVPAAPQSVGRRRLPRTRTGTATEPPGRERP